MHQLGFLATVLNERPPDAGRRFASIARLEYDARRPPEAPSSEKLVEQHGGWLYVCARAYGLQPDGSWVGEIRPWTTRPPGARAPRPYTKEEIRDALRVCSEELGRPPTTQMYDSWGAARRRRGGAVARTPTVVTIYRHYPAAAGGWMLALRDAGVT